MKSINFNGVGLDACTYENMFDLIDKWISNKNGRSHHIACINAFCIALSLSNKRLAQIYNGSDIAGPDGMPFVKWIHYIHRLACDRLDAPDIILQLAKESKKRKYTFYLYGGSSEVAIKMKEYLEQKFPHISIVGCYSPPFRAMTPEEDKAIVDEINSLKPDIICVGLGTPKQDYWIDEHIHTIRGSVFVASGATFDFFGGRIKLAPEFIRRSGFEWLYRLFSKDFKRLWKRYTYYNFVFMWNFFLQISRIRTIEAKRWVREENHSLENKM